MAEVKINSSTWPKCCVRNTNTHNEVKSPCRWRFLFFPLIVSVFLFWKTYKKNIRQTDIQTSTIHGDIFNRTFSMNWFNEPYEHSLWELIIGLTATACFLWAVGMALMGGSSLSSMVGWSLTTGNVISEEHCIGSESMPLCVLSRSGHEPGFESGPG